MNRGKLEHILELAGARSIRESNENLICQCPFHQDRHRSFSMSLRTGQYICFAESCGSSGGLTRFLMQGLHYDLNRARKVADELGTSIDAPSEEWPSLPTWKDRGKQQVEEKVPERLLGIYDFCPVYMLERGFSKKVLRKWEVGYDSRTATVTLPVRDAAGHLIGFTRRRTDGGFPKYVHLNFRKALHLYGEQAVASRAELWVAEGQLDAIALSQMGVDFSVSTMGSRVSKTQLRLLEKYRKVVLAFDRDSDGVAAEGKIATHLAARGVEVFVLASWPDGVKDPADVMSRGDGREFLDSAVPYYLSSGWRERYERICSNQGSEASGG